MTALAILEGVAVALATGALTYLVAAGGKKVLVRGRR